MTQLVQISAVRPALRSIAVPQRRIAQPVWRPVAEKPEAAHSYGRVKTASSVNGPQRLDMYV